MSKLSSPHSRLWAALERNDLAGLQAALADGANPNGAHGGWKPLGKALRRNYPELALALIQGGASVNDQDQHTPLVEIAAIGRGREGVLQAMLDRGATPTAEALRVACRSHCVGTVEALLAAGADPNDTQTSQGQQEQPAICWWMAQNSTPPPHSLRRATLDNPLTVQNAHKIAGHCGRHRHDVFMRDMAKSSTFPSEAWQSFLLHAMYSQWQPGQDFALEHRLVPTGRLGPSHASILCASANYLRNNRTKSGPLAQMERLIDYGFSPNDLGWTLLVGQDTGKNEWTDAPLFLQVIKNSGQRGRWKLVQFLLSKGASVECRYPDTGGGESYAGLAHVLIDQGDYATLAKLLRAVPPSGWEQTNDPGLIASILDQGIDKHHLAALHQLINMGAGVNRPDAAGKRPMEILLDYLDSAVFKPSGRTKPTLAQLRDIGELLVEHGLDLEGADSRGRMLGERMFLMGGQAMDEILAHWQAVALRRTTPTTPVQSTRMRL